MKIFTRNYRITGDYNEIFEEYFSGMKLCVFDIETTGLSPARSKVVLIGLLTKNDSGCTVTQFLAENHYEEHKVLDAAMDFIRSEGIDYLITYNGSSFDVPFMNERLKSVFGESNTSLNLYNFDLLRFLRQNTNLKQRIGSLSQKSVENYYGILSDRGDSISGRESVMLFDKYALSGSSTIEKVILTHNREDVLHLHRLMYASMASISDLHSAMSRYGFPAARGRLSVKYSVKNKSLVIVGNQNYSPISSAYFPDMDCNISAVFNAATSSYEIDVPLGRLRDNYYIDLHSLGLGTADNPCLIGEADLSTDSDFVNGYLILNPRSLNLISRLIAESYI